MKVLDWVPDTHRHFAERELREVIEVERRHVVWQIRTILEERMQPFGLIDDINRDEVLAVLDELRLIHPTPAPTLMYDDDGAMTLDKYR